MEISQKVTLFIFTFTYKLRVKVAQIESKKETKGENE